MPEGVNETEVNGKANERWNRYEEQRKSNDLKAKCRAFLLLFEEQCFNDAGRSKDHQTIEEEPHTRGIRTHNGQKDVVGFGPMELADATNNHTSSGDALHGASTDAE